MGEVREPEDSWYGPLAEHLGEAYLRYAFTRGTEAEVDFLYRELELEEGSRLLDVGMGPGRHALELARRGVQVVGVDLSEGFVELARQQAKDEGLIASFFVMDARSMPFDEEFDAVMSICEGAFSLGLDDLQILREMSMSLKPGGRFALAAVNAFYVVSHMRDSGRFDPAKMLYHEQVEVVGADGTAKSFEMWNSCYTPRELAWIANGASLETEGVYGINPGEYRREPPTADHPELLGVGKKPL